jgi:hypothetical protein
MSVVDPFEKAADCARAIQISTDPVRKDILHNLQQMWIALATEKAQMTPEQLSREAEVIGRLHLKLTGTDRTHH